MKRLRVCVVLLMSISLKAPFEGIFNRFKMSKGDQVAKLVSMDRYRARPINDFARRLIDRTLQHREMGIQPKRLEHFDRVNVHNYVLPRIEGQTHDVDQKHQDDEFKAPRDLDRDDHFRVRDDIVPEHYVLPKQKSGIELVVKRSAQVIQAQQALEEFENDVVAASKDDASMSVPEVWNYLDKKYGSPADVRDKVVDWLYTLSKGPDQFIKEFVKNLSPKCKEIINSSLASSVYVARETLPLRKFIQINNTFDVVSSFNLEDLDTVRTFLARDLHLVKDLNRHRDRQLDEQISSLSDEISQAADKFYKEEERRSVRIRMSNLVSELHSVDTIVQTQGYEHLGSWLREHYGSKKDFMTSIFLNLDMLSRSDFVKEEDLWSMPESQQVIMLDVVATMLEHVSGNDHISSYADKLVKINDKFHFVQHMNEDQLRNISTEITRVLNMRVHITSTVDFPVLATDVHKRLTDMLQDIANRLKAPSEDFALDTNEALRAASAVDFFYDINTGKMSTHRQDGASNKITILSRKD